MATIKTKLITKTQDEGVNKYDVKYKYTKDSGEVLIETIGVYTMEQLNMILTSKTDDLSDWQDTLTLAEAM